VTFSKSGEACSGCAGLESGVERLRLFAASRSTHVEANMLLPHLIQSAARNAVMILDAGCEPREVWMCVLEVSAAFPVVFYEDEDVGGGSGGSAGSERGWLLVPRWCCLILLFGRRIFFLQPFLASGTQV
jgi:hypothetical protein